MDTLSQRYLQHSPAPIKPLLKEGKTTRTFDAVPIDIATHYAAEDADVTLRLWHQFRPKLGRLKVTRVYETMERPLVPVLQQMERNGVRIDCAHLAAISTEFATKMSTIEARVHSDVGRPFNLASPKQLGEILFDEMEVAGGKRGKGGAYATGSDVLEDIIAQNSTGSDLARNILEWRQLAKLKSTYVDALPQHIHPESGRVHTRFSIAGASTGRLASSDPNLQNIPIRTREGRRIREAFIPCDGNVLVSLDYSQIELRILAQIANIPALKEAFHKNQDIHTLTASQMFGIAPEKMDPITRRRAKAINFGIIYGISAFGLARNLRIPRTEAQSFISTYFERFPGIKAYMTETTEFARKHGYVQTMFGRKIHTPNIGSKGPEGGFSRRAAINAPIQGTAADIIRRAMIRIPPVLRNHHARMLLQVHDELVFEMPHAEVDTLCPQLQAIMENAAFPVLSLDVPLTVDIGMGDNWATAH